MALGFENIIVRFFGNFGMRVLGVNLLFDKSFGFIRNSYIKRYFAVFYYDFKRNMVVSAFQPGHKAALSFEAGNGRKKSFGYRNFFAYLIKAGLCAH